MHRPTKRRIADGSDGRRRYQLDEIRTLAWLDFIRQKVREEQPPKVKAPTAYGLNERLGEGHQKWADYLAGKRAPNQATIDSIETQLPGSREIFMSGPGGTRLWPALESDDHDRLRLIARRAHGPDGEIARLRLEAETYSIPVEYVPPPGFFALENLDEFSPRVWFNDDTLDDFKCGLGLVRLSLEAQNLLSEECRDRVIDYLAEKLQPYRIAAYRRAFEEVDDGFNSGSPTFERVEEEVLQSLEARSIHNKGAK